MKTSEKLGIYLKFAWKGHITNPLWRERVKRRKIRKEQQECMKQSLLRDFIPFARALKADYPELPRTGGEEDEKVYCMWFQGIENAPEIVQKCVANTKSRFPDKFVFLTEENLSDYITLPDHVMRKWKEGKIIPANFSDLVRIELLYQYGGYWFDATDFITGPMPEVVKESDFFMFITSPRLFSRMFVQTCFIRAKKGNPLLGMWRSLVFEYWRRENKAMDYFLVHYLLKFLVRNNKEAAALFDKMPKLEQDRSHDLWYKIGNEPFDEKRYREMANSIFFQKCSYKKGGGALTKILPGSMADYVINGKAKTLNGD